MLGKSLLGGLFFAIVALGPLACEDPAGIDEPCESDESCEEGLVCDGHGGELTCQEPHGHGPTATTATTSSGSTSSGAMGGGGGGGASDPCADYCACLEPACGTFAEYPYDAAGSCLAACQAYTQPELACFSAFCVQASEAVAGKEHLCEHAWGGAGTGEC